MKDGGFTLTEMLVAMTVMGLVVGGLGQAARSISRLQTAAAETSESAQGTRRADQGLEAFFHRQGAFAGDSSLVGSDRSLEFACEQGAICRILVRAGASNDRLFFEAPGGRSSLAAGSKSNLQYLTDSASLAGWPPARPAGPRLRAVVLTAGVGARERPIAVARLYEDEPDGCIFDVIAQACRLAP